MASIFDPSRLCALMGWKDCSHLLCEWFIGTNHHSVIFDMDLHTSVWLRREEKQSIGLSLLVRCWILYNSVYEFESVMPTCQWYKSVSRCSKSTRWYQSAGCQVRLPYPVGRQLSVFICLTAEISTICHGRRLSFTFYYLLRRHSVSEHRCSSHGRCLCSLTPPMTLQWSHNAVSEPQFNCGGHLPLWSDSPLVSFPASGSHS